MADIRIKDLPTTASQTASDDFIALDGTVNGTRKIDASAPSFKTSVTSPSVAAPATTDLTLAGGSSGASLVLGQGANGNATITPSGTGKILSGTTGSEGGVGLSAFSVGTATGLGGTAYRVSSFYSTAAAAADRPGVILGFDTAGAGVIAAATQATGQPLAFWTYNGSAWGEKMRLATTGNLLIGTTTDISGTGGLKVAGTSTASSTTSGALQVGSNVGLSGNAGGASYFGGNVLISNPSSSVFQSFQSQNDNGSNAVINVGTSGSARGGTYFGLSEANLSLIFANGTSSAGLGIGTFNAKPLVLGTNNTAALTFNATTQAATFAGAVTVSSTTSASSSTVGAFLVGNGTAATNVAIGDGYIRAGSAIFANNAGTNTQLALGSVASAATTYSKLRTDGSGGLDVSAGSGGALSFGYDNARPVGAYGVWTFNSSTASTNTTSGALVVTGGVGVGGAINAGGNLTSPDLILGTSGPSAKSSIAARAARQGLVFDGTGFVTGTGVPAYGTGSFSIQFPRVVFSNLTGTQWLIGPLTGVSAFGLKYVAGTGLLASNVTVADITASTATFIAGAAYAITYVRASGVGTYYVNGVAAGTVTDSQNYANASLSIGAVASSNNFSGVLGPIYAYNRALSAAEVVSLYEAGVPAGADYNILPAGNSFSFTGASAFTGYNGIAASSVTATSFSASGTATNPFGSGVYGSLQVRSVPGMRYRATWSFTPVSGTAPLVGMGWESNGTWTNTVAASVGSAEFVVTTGANALKFAFITANGNTTSYSVSNITLTPLGLLLAPDAAQSGGGLTWYDTSGNAANITLPATGVTWNVPTSGYLTSSSSLNLRAGGTNQNITLTPSGTGNTFVSGFGVFSSNTNALGSVPSTIGISLGYNKSGGDAEGNLVWGTGLAASVPLRIQSWNGTTLSTVATFASSRFLLGTSLDSGALLQVGTNTTTSAGGIGFGTDNNLFRYNSIQLALTNSSGTSGSAIASNIQLRIENSGNGGLQVNVPDASTGGVYFGRASDAYYTAIERSGTNLQLRNAGATALTIASTGAATFAGAVAIGNTTSAAVAAPSTHKVSILIGGVQYYLLASNV